MFIKYISLQSQELCVRDSIIKFALACECFQISIGVVFVQALYVHYMQDDVALTTPCRFHHLSQHREGMVVLYEHSVDYVMYELHFHAF